LKFGHLSTPQKLRMTKPFTSKAFPRHVHNKLHTKFYNAVICGINAPV